MVYRVGLVNKVILLKLLLEFFVEVKEYCFIFNIIIVNVKEYFYLLELIYFKGEVCCFDLLSELFDCFYFGKVEWDWVK